MRGHGVGWESIQTGALKVFQGLDGFAGREAIMVGQSLNIRSVPDGLKRGVDVHASRNAVPNLASAIFETEDGAGSVAAAVGSVFGVGGVTHGVFLVVWVAGIGRHYDTMPAHGVGWGSILGV